MSVDINTLEKRVEKLEYVFDNLSNKSNGLKTDIEVIKAEIRTVVDGIGDLKLQVQKLSELPGRRWDMVVGALIVALAGAVITILTK